MDTVILAAGRGARLDGIAAPFHKPLLVVNGLPLIVQLVGAAHATFRGSEDDARIVVVVAAENAQSIAAVLQAHKYHEVHYVLQPRAHGPGDALRRGLAVVGEGRVMVLMADNVVSQATLERVVDEANPYAISYVNVPSAEAVRFTRFNRRTSQWEERVPVTIDHCELATEKAVCWVGPIVIDRDTALRELECHCGVVQCDAEILIGPRLSRLVPNRSGCTLVEVDVTDIGLPEMWT